MIKLGISRGVLALGVLTGVAFAAPTLAHGGQGFGYGYGHGPCYKEQGANRGLTGLGMMDNHMRGDHMGPGMMGKWMERGPMMGPDAGLGEYGMRGYLDRDLGVDEVKSILAHRLLHHGNDRLRVGNVEKKDENIIVAEIETTDGSLVERYEVDRHTGRMQRAR